MRTKKMVNDIKGVIEVVEIKEDKVSVTIDGRWFTAWKNKIPIFPFVEGDYVEGTYTTKANLGNPDYPYCNLISLEKKDKPLGWTEKQEHREMKIIRQACFKAACSAYTFDSKKETARQVDIIIEIAKAGEKYVLQNNEPNSSL